MGSGLPTQALISDMNQVLGSTAGNAVEVREAIDFLTGAAREPRLLQLTLALAGRMLWLGGLAALPAKGEQRRCALDDGSAAERFARMVAGLGGPANAAGARRASAQRAGAARAGRAARRRIQRHGHAQDRPGDRGARWRPPPRGDKVDPRVASRGCCPGQPR